MKIIDVYDEITSGTDIAKGPTITVASRSKLENEQKAKVLAYLKSGTLVMAARHLEDDLLNPELKAATATYVTDGAYVWSGRVEYYLAKYDLAPDLEFVNYVLTKNGELATPVSQEQIAEAIKEFDL